LRRFISVNGQLRETVKEDVIVLVPATVPRATESQPAPGIVFPNTACGPSVASPLLNRRSTITAARRIASGSRSSPSFSGESSVNGGSFAGVRSCADASDVEAIDISETNDPRRTHRRSGSGVLFLRITADVLHVKGQADSTATNRLRQTACDLQSPSA
jgi:hypothetical protein